MARWSMTRYRSRMEGDVDVEVLVSVEDGDAVEGAVWGRGQVEVAAGGAGWLGVVAGRHGRVRPSVFPNPWWGRASGFEHPGLLEDSTRAGDGDVGAGVVSRGAAGRGGRRRCSGEGSRRCRSGCRSPRWWGRWRSTRRRCSRTRRGSRGPGGPGRPVGRAAVA